MLKPASLLALPLLFLLSACDFATPPAFSERCDSTLPLTSVDVEVAPEEVIEDNSRSIAELTKMPPLAPPNSPWTVKLGLTSAALSSEVSVNFSFLTSPEGETCMRPAIRVKLSASPQRLYIARELTPGSCAYNHVLEHERRHAHANQAQVVAVSQWLKDELKAHFGDNIYRGDKDEMEVQMAEAIREQWIPMAQEALTAVETTHQTIDTPEEYARNHTVCDGVIPPIVRAASQ